MNNIFIGSEFKLNVSIEPISDFTMDDYDFKCEFWCYSNRKVTIEKKDMSRQDEYTIYYEDWMTWEDWCDSEYNTFGWTCDVVSGKPKCVVLSNDPVAYVPDWLATRYISNSTSEPIVMVEDLGWG